jgi:hypothetical protein
VTVAEFRKRYRINAARWRQLVDGGDLPTITSGPRKRAEICEADAEAWARRQPEKFQVFVLGEPDG